MDSACCPLSRNECVHSLPGPLRKTRLPCWQTSNTTLQVNLAAHKETQAAEHHVLCWQASDALLPLSSQLIGRFERDA